MNRISIRNRFGVDRIDPCDNSMKRRNRNVRSDSGREERNPRRFDNANRVVRFSSISRVASSPELQPGDERVLRRIRAEFLEMPGLSLTIEQAQRLWSLKPRTCEVLLTSLINSRFLRRTDRGLFVRRPS